MRNGDKRDYTVLGIILFFCAMFLVGFHGKAFGHDRAGHNEVVLGEKFNITSLACDEQEQIHTILTAQYESWDEALAIARLFMQTPNGKGEAKCAYGRMQQITALELVATYQDVPNNLGQETTYYVVKVSYEGDDNEFFTITSWPVVTHVGKDA